MEKEHKPSKSNGFGQDGMYHGNAGQDLMA